MNERKVTRKATALEDDTSDEGADTHVCKKDKMVIPSSKNPTGSRSAYFSKDLLRATLREAGFNS